jgi:hypothetical protein
MIDTNHWGYQQILREAIQYRILRRMIEAPRTRVNGLPKTESDELDPRFLEALATVR